MRQRYIGRVHPIDPTDPRAHEGPDWISPRTVPATDLNEARAFTKLINDQFGKWKRAETVVMFRDATHRQHIVPLTVFDNILDDLSESSSASTSAA